VESEKIQALFADEDLRARIFSKETRQALQRVEQKAEERRPEPAEEEETPEQ
jgi:hypothetical protein